MTDFANPFGGNTKTHLSRGVSAHITGNDGYIAEHVPGVDLYPTEHTQNGSIYSITSGRIVSNNGLGYSFNKMTIQTGIDSGKYMSWAGPYGIAIQGDDGHLYSYAHLSSNNVHIGQHVSAGQHIGEMGTRGNSSGPHLHIQIGYNRNYNSSDESLARDLEQKIIHDGPWNNHASSHHTPTTHPTNTNHSTPCQIKYSTDIHVKAIYKLHTYADNKCTIRNSYLIPELTQFWMIQDSNTGNYLVYTNNLPYFNQPVFLKHQVMTEQDVIATPDYGTK